MSSITISIENIQQFITIEIVIMNEVKGNQIRKEKVKWRDIVLEASKGLRMKLSTWVQFLVLFKKYTENPKQSNEYNAEIFTLKMLDNKISPQK